MACGFNLVAVSIAQQRKLVFSPFFEQFIVLHIHYIQLQRGHHVLQPLIGSSL